MRLAWFTPFSRMSAIGRFSRDVVAVLRRSVNVDLFFPATDDPLETNVHNIAFEEPEEILSSLLASYDAVLYNFGNHYSFHGKVYAVAQRFPGIAILHDFVMHHFFAEYFFEHLRKPDRYVRLMQTHYGEDGHKKASAFVRGEETAVWESAGVVNYPLFEEVIHGALGVVAHSEFFLRHIRDRFAGPVRAIGLAYEVNEIRPALSRRDLGVPENQILISTVGHVNRNKRIHAVIEALAENGDLSGKFTYAVLGPHQQEYFSELTATVARLGLDGSVTFLGYVTDDVLHSYLAHSDVCVNLRHPNIEGASASAIEAMFHGKALLVSDSGFFGELPDECVAKVHPSEEHMLGKKLRTLLEDRSHREELGKAAQRYALQHFTASHYVSELLRFLDEVCRTSPIIQFTDRVAAELSIMGVQPEMEIVSQVAQQSSLMFDQPEPDSVRGISGDD